MSEESKSFGGVILSPGCINRCLFCSPSKASREEVREQATRVAKNLVEFKKKGIKKIEISGSDPIEYESIIPLVKYIKKMGFEFVQLSTHGRFLADEKFFNKLIQAGIDKLRIPLYGSKAEIHDSVTRAKGSFKEVYKGLKMLRTMAPFVETQVSSLIMQQNKNDLTNIIDLMVKLGINDFYFSIPLLHADGDDSYYVPSSNLTRYAKKAYEHAEEIGYPARFIEIPYCVFGRESELINNVSLPPNLGKHCQPPKQFKTSIKDLPSYRLKRKIDICKKCKCADRCHGFLVNDIKKFGIKNIKPIRK